MFTFPRGGRNGLIGIHKTSKHSLKGFLFITFKTKLQGKN